jgi:hypothetical protein
MSLHEGNRLDAVQPAIPTTYHARAPTSLQDTNLSQWRQRWQSHCNICYAVVPTGLVLRMHTSYLHQRLATSMYVASLSPGGWAALIPEVCQALKEGGLVQ